MYAHAASSLAQPAEAALSMRLFGSVSQEKRRGFSRFFMLGASLTYFGGSVRLGVPTGTAFNEVSPTLPPFSV